MQHVLELSFQDFPRARQFHRLPGQGLFRQLLFGDVRSDGNVLLRFSIRSYERNNRRIQPVSRTILRPVLYLAVPNLFSGDGAIHLLEELSGCWPEFSMR